LADLFKFPKENEEVCDCETCLTVEGYLEQILDADHPGEIEALLRGLYDTAYGNGYDQSLRDDILQKQEMLVIKSQHNVH
jgi:hypothetical protein